MPYLQRAVASIFAWLTAKYYLCSDSKMANKIEWNYVFYISVFLLVAIVFHLKYRQDIPFPPTLVINLDSRKDRYDEITNEFRKWPASIERVSAVMYSPGWKGCSASHLKCVQIAKEREYPWVVILEDDCILTTSAIHQFQSVLPYLWNHKNDWDIFYGGTTLVTKSDHVSYIPRIYEVKGYAAHFSLIHRSTYDSILQGHPKEISEYKIPIDVYYSQNFRIWTTLPFFAKQRASQSDIESGVADYTGLFDAAEKKISDI